MILEEKPAFITDAGKVYINYGTPEQKEVGETVSIFELIEEGFTYENK